MHCLEPTSIEKSPALWPTIDRYFELAKTVRLPHPAQQQVLAQVDMADIAKQIAFCQSILPSPKVA